MKEVNVIQGIERLSKVLSNDKHINPSELTKVIKSDFLGILENYMNYYLDTCVCEIIINDIGEYEFIFKINASRIKYFNVLPN